MKQITKFDSKWFHDYYIKNKKHILKRNADYKELNRPEIVKCKREDYRLNKQERLKHQRAYSKSPKGQEVLKRQSKFYYNIKNLRYRKNLILENCAICDSSDKIEIHHPNIDMSDYRFQSLHVYFLCHKHHMNQHYRGI